MKKIYTLVAAFAVVLSANAQNKSVNAAPKKMAQNPKLQTVTDLSTFKSSTSNGRAYSGWLNYALQLDDISLGYTPGAAVANFMLVYPDTNVIVGQYTDGSTAYPQFHKAATMLDPKNMPVQGIASTDAYSLDSIGIAYGYLRSLSSSVVDTIRVDIIKHDAALQWDLTNATYQDITYTYTNDKITPSQIIGTYYYYLTEADSSDSAAELFIKTTLPVQAAGNRIGAVVTFIPGFTATVTDSIQDKNSFYVLSYEQNGASTDPIFYGTIADGTSDLNCSYALPSSVRYNTNANGWNGYLIPTWAWTTPYQNEHHIIEFKISAPPTGIDELASNGIKFEQNYPNPFSNNSVVNFELAKNAKVALSVYDVTGKKVIEINKGDLAAGKHAVTINADDLAAGVYYYSISVNANTTSAMKMVVVK